MANVSKLNSLWNRWLRLSGKLHVALLLLRWRCSLWHHLMSVEMLLFTITVTYKALPPTIYKNKHGGHDFTSFQFSILGLPWGSPPGWTCKKTHLPRDTYRRQPDQRPSPCGAAEALIIWAPHPSLGQDNPQINLVLFLSSIIYLFIWGGIHLWLI